MNLHSSTTRALIWLGRISAVVGIEQCKVMEFEAAKDRTVSFVCLFEFGGAQLFAEFQQS